MAGAPASDDAAARGLETRGLELDFFDVKWAPFAPFLLRDSRSVALNRVKALF